MRKNSHKKFTRLSWPKWWQSCPMGNWAIWHLQNVWIIWIGAVWAEGWCGIWRGDVRRCDICARWCHSERSWCSGGNKWSWLDEWCGHRMVDCKMENYFYHFPQVQQTLSAFNAPLLTCVGIVRWCIRGDDSTECNGQHRHNGNDLQMTNKHKIYFRFQPKLFTCTIFGYFSSQPKYSQYFWQTFFIGFFLVFALNWTTSLSDEHDLITIDGTQTVFIPTENVSHHFNWRHSVLCIQNIAHRSAIMTIKYHPQLSIECKGWTRRAV